MIEVDIPLTTVNLLYSHVLLNIGNRTLGEFPFYTKVTDSLLDDAFSNIVDLSCVSTGYIYAHDETIPLHVDRYKKDSVYNLNVPIYVLVNSKKDNNHLESICYTGKRPAETAGVTGVTEQPVNNDILNDLPFDSGFYYGLNGKSWTQTPGKGLLFKSTQLHCTGKQTKFKIGCVLIMNSLGLLSNL